MKKFWITVAAILLGIIGGVALGAILEWYYERQQRLKNETTWRLLGGTGAHT